MTEQSYSFRNLILWQKAQELTMEVVTLMSRLPNDKLTTVVSQQIMRSASSIGANVAEGHGRYSLGAHRNHLSIAKGSACETDGWLDLLRRAGYLDSDTEARLHEACQELIRMLTAKILDFERKESQRGKNVRDEAASYATEAPEEQHGASSRF